MYFVSLHGHENVLLPALERRADAVHARHEVAVLAEHVERAGAHARHDPHRNGDVGRVGELDADVGDRGAERAHRERHDVQRAPAHAALEQAAERLAHLGRVLPVVRRSCVGLVLRADEGAVLDARDIARVGQRQVRVGLLRVGEALERAGVDELLAEPVVLLSRPVAPVDAVRLGQCCDVFDPGAELCMAGRRVGVGIGDAHVISLVAVAGHPRDCSICAETVLPQGGRGAVAARATTAGGAVRRPGSSAARARAA